MNQKGWQHYFKSYCIPEDLVPRILSPAYFHHYNAQCPLLSSEAKATNLSTLKREEAADKLKGNEGERLVLGLGPVQRSFWRLSKLVPLEGVRRQLSKYSGKKIDSIGTSSLDTTSTALVEDEVEVVEAQSLEIQESSDGISLKPISETLKEPLDEARNGKFIPETATKDGDGRKWRRVPYLPSYIPFGEVLTQN